MLHDCCFVSFCNSRVQTSTYIFPWKSAAVVQVAAAEPLSISDLSIIMKASKNSSCRMSGFAPPLPPLPLLQDLSLIPFTSPPKPNLKVTDVSFSSYLEPDEDREAEEEEERTKKDSPPNDDTELSIFDAQKYFNEPNIDQIFNTHKKNDILADPVLAPRTSSVSSADGFGRNFRTRSFRSYATPTASSEASWNSHTGLLANPPGAISVTLRDPTSDRKSRHGSIGSGTPRWFLFHRKCPCSGKKSVQVQDRRPELRSLAARKSYRPKEEVVHVPKIHLDNGSIADCSKRSNFGVINNHPSDLQDMIPNPYTRFSLTTAKPFTNEGPTNGGFTFPILNPTNSSPPIRKILNSTVLPQFVMPLPVEDPPRDSIEVFRPSDSGGLRRSREFQAKAVPCRAPPVVPSCPALRDDGRAMAAFSPASPREDDAASDASSDLFEIESFSTSQSGSSYPAMTYPIHHRDSLDEARPRFSTSGNKNNNNNVVGHNYYDSATDCGYEPSEASIAWSVTTAEGTAFDRASLAGCSVSASDVEEFTRVQVHLHQQQQGGNRSGGGGRAKGGAGILTSCRGERAISVGPDPVKYPPPRGGVGSGASTYRMGGYFRHVSSRVEGGNEPAAPSSSHSARMSLAFAT